MKIILASNSPRRKEILDIAKIEYEVIPSNIEEKMNEELPVAERIEDIAYQKVKSIRKSRQDKIILGADTVVLINDKIIGKPHSKKEAEEIIRLLSGKTHKVITGCCIYDNVKNEYIKFHEITEVTFYEMSDEEILTYIENPSIYDKAGAYGIQEDAALYIEKVNGDYYNIIGLPIGKVFRELKKISSTR